MSKDQNNINNRTHSSSIKGVEKSLLFQERLVPKTTPEKIHLKKINNNKKRNKWTHNLE